MPKPYCYGVIQLSTQFMSTRPSKLALEAYKLRLGVQNLQHLLEIMPALQHQAIGIDHRPLTLPVSQFRLFLDRIKRYFARPLEDGKDRAVLEHVNRIVPPFACSNPLRITLEKRTEIVAIERDTLLIFGFPGVLR